jgi:hypothetical protein
MKGNHTFYRNLPLPNDNPGQDPHSLHCILLNKYQDQVVEQIYDYLWNADIIDVCA